MMTTRSVASLLILLGLTGWVRGQGTLGLPVRHEDGGTPVMQATLVVHENGRNIRCRLQDTWQLADGRMAQLVEALDTGELITLLAEPTVQPVDGRTMPIRIFLWGVGRRMPPEGSPIPPRMAFGPNQIYQPPIILNTSSMMSPAMLPEAPTRVEIAKMIADGNYSPAEITAAKVLFDETRAKARQAAVKYLASVNCHYYPEAEASLIAALRADRCELVRLEAAQTLGSCRGVTVRILDALHVSASALETDGNPAETCEQVRFASRTSLNRLLATGMSVPAPAPLPVVSEWPAPPITTQPIPVAAAPMPPAPALLQRERDLAATVSTQHRTTAVPHRPTVYGLLLGFTGRDTSTRSQPGIDPRLRGMNPLGVDGDLAIQK
jgi:hypothetical protein